MCPEIGTTARLSESRREKTGSAKGGSIVDSKALAMLKIMRLVEKKKKARYEKRYKTATKKAS